MLFALMVAPMPQSAIAETLSGSSPWGDVTITIPTSLIHQLGIYNVETKINRNGAPIYELVFHVHDLGSMRSKGTLHARFYRIYLDGTRKQLQNVKGYLFQGNPGAAALKPWNQAVVYFVPK